MLLAAVRRAGRDSNPTHTVASRRRRRGAPASCETYGLAALGAASSLVRMLPQKQHRRSRRYDGPGGIRTPDRPVKSRTLSLTELPARTDRYGQTTDKRLETTAHGGRRAARRSARAGPGPRVAEPTARWPRRGSPAITLLPERSRSGRRAPPRRLRRARRCASRLVAGVRRTSRPEGRRSGERVRRRPLGPHGVSPCRR